MTDLALLVTILITQRGEFMQLLCFVLINCGASPTFEMKIRLLLRFDFIGKGCQSHFIDPHAMMATTEVLIYGY